MRIKSGFVLQKLIDDNVVVPIGEESNRDFILSLSKTATFLWEALKTERTETELVDMLTAAYDVDPDEAASDVSDFIRSLESVGCLA